MIIYSTEKNDKQKALDIVNKSVHRTRAFCIGDRTADGNFSSMTMMHIRTTKSSIAAATTQVLEVRINPS